MPQVEKPIVAQTQKILQKMPFWERRVGGLLQVSEGENGLSWMSCLRDTAVAWLPKIVVSRSLIEISESTFIEFLESAVVYFSVPLAAKGMHKWFRGYAQKGFTDGTLDKKWLGKTVGELSKEIKTGNKALQKQLPHLLSIKAATILGPMVAAGLGCEYLINYSKNLMTAKVFKKDKFSDVVNLSGGHMKSGEESEVVNKSLKRVLTTLGLMGGTLASSVALARFGHKLPPLKLDGLKKALKNTPLSKWANKLPDTGFEAIVGHFDYDAKKGGFSLAGNQLRWYMLASIPAYADAARDKLEQVESVSRLGIIMGYLAFGQQALEKGMLKLIKTYRGDLYDAMMTPADKNGKREVMKLDEVMERALQNANAKLKGRDITAKTVGDCLTKSDEVVRAILKEDTQLKQAVTAKNALFGVPMVVGILGTGVGLTLLNQFWTKYRFEKAQQGLALPPEDHLLSQTEKQQLAQGNTTGQLAPFQMQNNAQPLQWPFSSTLSRSSPFGQPATAVNGFSGYSMFNRYQSPRLGL